MANATDFIQDYIDSTIDPDQLEVMQDFECTLMDGLDDSNDWTNTEELEI